MTQRYEHLLFDVTDGIATITYNRQGGFNAIDMTLGRELLDAVTRVDADPSVRAVLMLAKGKMFSVGGDLGSFASYGDDVERALRELTGYLDVAVSRLLRLNAPVVVAVNGMAAGGGMSLALVGDIVLVAENARFTMAYTKAGLTPDLGATYALPRLVGLRRAQELIYTNRVLNAQEACEWGIGTRVVPDAQLEAEARQVASKLAEGPTRAFAATKRLLVSSAATSPEAQMELESRELGIAAKSADGQEGIAAFLSKRTPMFIGA